MDLVISVIPLEAVFKFGREIMAYAQLKRVEVAGILYFQCDLQYSTRYSAAIHHPGIYV
jgi:hypothetical protein